MPKLFISHAAQDKALVEAFVDLLETGVGVPHRDIFCSSLKGQSIKPGTDFVDSIRASLDAATCVLALISEAYYASAFCMCELGGVWLQSKSFLPVLVPPVDYGNLKAVLGGLHVSKIARDDDLDELRDELIERLEIDGHSTPRWCSKRKTFLAVLPERLKATQFRGPVERTVHDKLAKQFEDYQSEYEAREKEIQKLKSLIADLKKAKDAKAVTKIVRHHSTVAEAFDELVDAAAEAIKSLPPSVRESLYYRARNEEYFPEGQRAWDDVKTSLEYGMLVESNSEGDGVTPNDSNRDVQEAIAALDELEKWLVDAPEEFSAWYDLESDGEQPDVRLRSFWDCNLW